jgi:hypothetical protein
MMVKRRVKEEEEKNDGQRTTRDRKRTLITLNKRATREVVCK